MKGRRFQGGAPAAPAGCVCGMFSPQFSTLNEIDYADRARPCVWPPLDTRNPTLATYRLLYRYYQLYRLPVTFPASKPPRVGYFS
jgi:hypothetical protein